jgi:hypothetical protein
MHRNARNLATPRIHFDLDHGLVGMCRVGYHAVIGAVNQKVQARKDSLSDEHFRTEDQCLFSSAATVDINADRFGDVNVFGPIVDVGGPCLSHYCQAQSLDNVTWQNGPEGSSIDYCIRFAMANLIGGQQSPPNQRLIACIRECDFQSYLFHGRFTSCRPFADSAVLPTPRATMCIVRKSYSERNSSLVGE